MVFLLAGLLLFAAWERQEKEEGEMSDRYQDLPSMHLMAASDLHYLSPFLTDHGGYFAEMARHSDGKGSISLQPGEGFLPELLADGRGQILGVARYKKMIRMPARAVPVADGEQKMWIDTIFAEQSYLSNVYPGDTRDIGIVFQIKDAWIECFRLGVIPIFQETYMIRNEKISEKG